MANYVANEIIFRNADRAARENITGKVLNEGKVDFNILVPAPLNVWQGPVGQEEKAAFGDRNWYDWSIKNWGTKWNAWADKETPAVTVTGDTLVFVFLTAWNPPRLWDCALFNAGKHPFEHNWMSEGELKAYTERYLFDDEKKTTPARVTSGANTETYRRLHVLLFGAEPEAFRDF